MNSIKFAIKFNIYILYHLTINITLIGMGSFLQKIMKIPIFPQKK